MATEVRLIANLGYYNGASGKGNIFAGKSVIAGTYMFLVQHLEGGVTTWRYYRQESIISGIESGDVIMANDVNVSLFTNVLEPDFVTPAANQPFLIVPNVTNGANQPRLWDLNKAYSLKGEGVTVSEIEKVKLAGTTLKTTTDPVTGAVTTTPTTSFIPSDFGLLFSNPVQFIQDNALFVAAVLAVIYYVRRKNKKPLWVI